MEIYECILALIAGVGVFILAMKLLSDSLNVIAGEKMKTLLEKIAGNRIKGVLVGALATAVIQSSSATTVMVIGFVNADVMDLNQAAAIIIGANIGTTATGLLASLESLNISLYLSLLVFIGVMLAFIKRIKKIANLFAGLGMIFVGLKLMSDACNDESIKGSFENVLKKISFPLLLEFLGVIFTAIIQSSSAMTGIVIVMVSNGVMGMNNGLFITLGANVGTCVTAIITKLCKIKMDGLVIGIICGNINAKRTAVIHLTFNIFGCLLFTPILWIFNKPILNILGKIVSKEAMQIAYFHLFFNCTTALITTPLIDYLEKIAKYVVKDEKKEEEVIKGLINDVNNIDINPRETTNSLNEEEKDKKQDNEEKKYEPPLNMINEDLKDNNNQNYREKKEDITKDKREEKDHEKDFENIKVNKEKEKEKEEKIEEKNDNEEDKKEEIKDKNDNEKKEEKNGEEKANEKKEDDDIIEVKKDE